MTVILITLTISTTILANSSLIYPPVTPHFAAASLWCLLCTSLLNFLLQGGLKAAILADVMQGLTIIAVSVAIIFQGCIEVGGFGTVFERNKEGGRLDFLK